MTMSSTHRANLHVLTELDAIQLMAGCPTTAIIDEILLNEIERVEQRIAYLGEAGALTVQRHLVSAAKARRLELSDLIDATYRRGANRA